MTEKCSVTVSQYRDEFQIWFSRGISVAALFLVVFLAWHLTRRRRAA